MYRLEIVIDRFASDGLWQFCFKDLLDKYSEEELSVLVVRNVRQWMMTEEVPERLVVCENREQAKRLSEYLRLNMTPEQFQRVTCLEGYVGEHYFEKCVCSLQPLEKSLEQICDLIYKQAVINLDYCDFWHITKGTENWMSSMCGSIVQVEEEWKSFLERGRINCCMINLTGDVNVFIASDFVDMLSGCEDVLLGVNVENPGSNEMEVVIIYK